MVNTFENACVVGEKIYFFSYEVNGLFEIDINNRLCNYIGSLKKYSSKTRLFGGLIYVNDKLIIAPMCANDFVIYDLKKRIEKYIPIKNCNKIYNNECKFFAAILIGINVFFIGHWYPAIVKLNLKNEEVTYYEKWCSVLNKDLFRYNYCVRNTEILLACSYINKVMVFDTKNESFKFYKVGSSKRRYSGIIYDGKYYWLTPRHDNVLVKWNALNDEYKEITIKVGDIRYIQNGLSYAQSFLINQYIIMLPLLDFPVCIIDTLSDDIKIISSEWAIKDNYLRMAPLRGGFVYKGKLYVLNSYNSELYMLNMEQMNFEKVGLNTAEVFKSYKGKKVLDENIKFIFTNEIFSESYECDLQALIISIYDNLMKEKIKLSDKKGVTLWNKLIKSFD